MLQDLSNDREDDISSLANTSEIEASAPATSQNDAELSSPTHHSTPVDDQRYSSSAKRTQVTLSTSRASWSLLPSSLTPSTQKDIHTQEDKNLSRMRSPTISENFDIDELADEDSSSSRPAKKARLTLTDYYAVEGSKTKKTTSRSARNDFRERMLGFASQTQPIPTRLDKKPVENDEASENDAESHDRNVEASSQSHVDERMSDMDVNMEETSAESIGRSSEERSHLQSDRNLSGPLQNRTKDEQALFLDSPPSPYPVTPDRPSSDGITDGTTTVREGEGSQHDLQSNSEGDLAYGDADADNDVASADTGVRTGVAKPAIEVLRPNHFPLNTQSQAQSVRVDLARLEKLYSSLIPSSTTLSPSISSSESTKNEGAKLTPPSATHTLSLRVIHKKDFLSVSSLSSDHDTSQNTLNTTASTTSLERMHVVGQFNLGFIVVRLARKRKERHNANDFSPSTGLQHSSLTGPTSESDDQKEKELDETDDLFIIDQHAADEKYNFETLQATTRIDSQRLVR